MATIENEDFWREFIDMYKDCPELWQVKNERYNKRGLRQKAYEKLLQKLKELHPYATEATLKRKLSIIKDSYRRELTKLRRSQKEATNIDQVYKPQLWFFNELSFLDESADMTNSENDEEIEVSTQTLPVVTDKKNEITKKSEASAHSLQGARFLEKFNDKSRILAKKFIGNKLPTPDDANVFSATWATLFRKLAPEQQMFANKAIMDVLYQGQLCRLQDSSIGKIDVNEMSDISLRSSDQNIKVNDLYTWKN